MQEIINNLVELIKNSMANTTPFISVLIGMGAIILESIIPILPLAVFIAINVIVFGTVGGFFISWIATVIGCVISFTLFKKGIGERLYRQAEAKKELGFSKKIINKINHLPFSDLVLITALPFTPAFTINIACGLSDMSYKKFISVMLLAKLVVVYFWGFIGSTLLDSITDINKLLQLALLLIISYVLGRLAMKKMNFK